MESMRISYIGEPITATGLALIGARIHTPPSEAKAVWALLLKVRPESDLVILNQAHAGVVAARLNALLQAEPIPPVLLLPSMDENESPLFEITRDARRALGLS